MIHLPDTLVARWRGLQPREKLALCLATLAITTLMLWKLALAPLLQTVRHAPAQHRQLDEKLRQMQALQAQAQALQALPKIGRETMVHALELSLQPFGQAARLKIDDVQATLTLQRADASILAQWLIQLRSEARLQPAEIHLRRSGSPPAWDGTLVFRLPAPLHR